MVPVGISGNLVKWNQFVAPAEPGQQIGQKAACPGAVRFDHHVEQMQMQASGPGQPGRCWLGRQPMEPLLDIVGAEHGVVDPVAVVLGHTQMQRCQGRDRSGQSHQPMRVEVSRVVSNGRLQLVCHLCRGLGVTEAPRELMHTGGLTYLPAEEEDVCCGFGGTYSMKFPELSSELLKKKLANVEKTGAELLLTDCPGCIMQLRGGLEAKGSSLQVQHVAEALAERLK